MKTINVLRFFLFSRSFYCSAFEYSRVLRGAGAGGLPPRAPGPSGPQGGPRKKPKVVKNSRFCMFWTGKRGGFFPFPFLSLALMSIEKNTCQNFDCNECL